MTAAVATRVREARKQCSMPACTLPGRLFSCGWRCDVHRPGADHALPSPDPESTAVGIRRNGHKRIITRTVVSAMLDGLTEEEVVEALRAGVRQHSLHF